MYALMNIVGPILLLAVIIIVTVRTWKRRPAEEAVSDASARRLRRELNEEDTGVSAGPPEDRSDRRPSGEGEIDGPRS